MTKPADPAKERTPDAGSSTAQNSGDTARPRTRGRPFVKGISGNPGGRPKGLVQVIRASTRDGEEIARFMLRVLRDQVPGVRLSDRLSAATWLADRGFGKPIASLELNPLEASQGPIYSYLSREQADQLRALDAAVDRGEIDLLELYDRAAPMFAAEQRAWEQTRSSRCPKCESPLLATRQGPSCPRCGPLPRR
jgi:hypothetical protein